MMVSEPRLRKVLIVDDEPLVRQTLAYVLQDEYEVVAVGSGEEALEASRREPFPVVILDLCMEGISGIETLRRLKKMREHQNVIILTAYESTDTAISALNLGAFNYLTKPFERSHLKQIVSRGFDLYESQAARTRDLRQRLMGVHDSFFALLCHEFNTPLNIILGFSELLQNGPADPDFQTWVQHIRDSGNHLHEILMEIVDYTAASHLAEAGVEKYFSPGELLQPVFEFARERGVVLHFQAEGAAGGRLRGPSDAILMVVKKFVRVASHRSRKVRVAASMVSHDGPNLRIVVGGTGYFSGTVEGDEIEKLFAPYQTVSATPGSSGAMSLGLELATCHKIAEYAHASVEGAFDARGELELAAQVPVSVAG